jgi:hypothetical protein
MAFLFLGARIDGFDRLKPTLRHACVGRGVGMVDFVGKELGVNRSVGFEQILVLLHRTDLHLSALSSRFLSKSGCFLRFSRSGH